MKKISKKRVIAYLHTHWDREWYREKEEFNLRLLEVFDEVLDELTAGCAPCFYFDGQTSAINDYLKFRPQKLKLVKKLIKEKKLFVGPFFVSADAFLSNLRCLIKNLEDGIKYSKRLGCDDYIGYLCDIFGHSRGVFEVLKKLNIKNAIIWRGTGAISADFNVRGVNTTRLVEGYFNDILHQNLPVYELAQQIELHLDKIARYSGNVLLLPLGADHLAILKDSSKKIEQINNLLQKYEIEIAAPQKYFKIADFSNAQEYEGEFLDNSVNYILGGVYSSRIYQKVQNTKIMHKITRIIEPLNYLLKLNYKPNIDYAYFMLLKNHAHDSIYGCSTDAVHKSVDERFEKVNEILNGLEKRIIRDFDKTGDKPENIAVFNLSNFKNSGIVKIISEHKFKNAQILTKIPYFCDSKLYSTRQIPVTEDILPLYEQLVEINPVEPFTFSVQKNIKPQKQTKISTTGIENPYLKLWVEDKKINVQDKKTGNVYYNYLKITDTKDGGDSYNYAPVSEPKIFEPKKTKVVKDGIIQSALRIYFKNLELDVILNNKSEFFEFRAKINNKEKNHKLQAVFCPDEPITTTYAQDSLGIIKRECDPNYSLFDHEPAIRPHELKTNSFPMMNFVFAQNSGVLSEGLNEYEIYKNELRIALLRSTGIISNPKNPARSIPAGPPIKTPDLQCLAEQNVRFGACFCDTAQDLFKYSEEFLATYLAYASNADICNKTFLKIPQNHLFYGINDKGEAILYDDNKDTIVLKKLANKAKVI